MHLIQVFLSFRKFLHDPPLKPDVTRGKAFWVEHDFQHGKIVHHRRLLCFWAPHPRKTRKQSHSCGSNGGDGLEGKSVKWHSQIVRIMLALTYICSWSIQPLFVKNPKSSQITSRCSINFILEYQQVSLQQTIRLRLIRNVNILLRVRLNQL